MEKIERTKSLVKQLNHYRNEYYNNQNSEISDLEYDNLYDELLALERETGFVMATSPTQTVGYEVKSELSKVKHNHPMLSLDKTKDIKDVVKFLDGRRGVVMAKMDGLTCSLRYVNGELVSAETRGDGETGEDILHCAKTIKNIPLHINCKDEVIVDGEVIISYDDFEKINATLPEDEKYKHPRNLASGSIRQLDGSIAAQRNMQFIAWKLIKGSDENSFWQRLSFMSKLGFSTVATGFIQKRDMCDEYYVATIEGTIDEIKKMAKEIGYPIDGCVIGYDDVAYGDSLGATGHHLRSQMAYKFYDELYETKLLDIEWTMGKTNTLTPTAIFETVNIDGTDISKASLHNISIIKKLGLTNNCTVRVYKANQIIPQIDSCLQDGDSPIIYPNRCPICGHETEVVTENASEVLMCTNPNCLGKLLGRLKFFVSKSAMNIDGLSEAILDLLIGWGWVTKFKDIYYLYEHGRQWEQIGGFGEKSVAKILDAIDRSRQVSLANFICALSIDGVGKSASKTIADAFGGDFNAFYQAFKNHYNWADLQDIGDKTASNITKYLTENDAEIVDLASEMRFIIPIKTEAKDNPFSGKTLCVTGKLNHFTRDSINAKISELGAKSAGSVSKNTDYLITNEASGSSKYKKAVELHIPIINEEEFLAMINQ
jgi:DNA ligase (NAD+)